MILLAKEYESKNFSKVFPPDPIDAILFRMDQQKLSQRDLIPLIGSRSKVSEILSGKRPLTIKMIRNLHENLGIPWESLMHEDQKAGKDLEEKSIQWSKFPIKEIISRKWVDCKSSDDPQSVIGVFLKPLGVGNNLLALHRKSNSIRSARSLNSYSLMLWNARVQILAKNEKHANYKPGTINKDFISEIVRLSYESDGPILAKKRLSDSGIRLVTERHLAKTYVDGAAIADPKGPIIGLTLRYDRIDNFWFCLAHELAHISLHLDSKNAAFFDDLDQKGNNTIEEEADDLANEAIFPAGILEEMRKNAYMTGSLMFVKIYAEKLKIHPAILAGKIRHMTKNYRLYSKFVSNSKIRPYFES